MVVGTVTIEPPTQQPVNRNTLPLGNVFGTTQNHRLGWYVKVALRAASLPDGDDVVVYDAFGGEGAIWRAVRAVMPDRRVRVAATDLDTAHSRRPGSRHVDNVTALRGVDLDAVDGVDLDAWGTPVDQLAVLSERKYAGRIWLTFNMVGIASVPRSALPYRGIPDAWHRVAPLMLREKSRAWILEQLALMGWESVEYVPHPVAQNPGAYAVLNGTVDHDVYRRVMMELQK